MANEIRKIILEAHARKLKAATTFEEYKAAHIEYIEYLIARFDMDDTITNLTLRYIENPDANR